MSPSELARLEACQRLEAGILTQTEVGRQLGLSDRQVRRLLVRYRRAGPAGIRSRRRGSPSNRRLGAQLITQVLSLVREHYADFGPTFANEKLREVHGLRLSTESLRQLMIADGLWQAKRKPRRRVHPPRERRPCFGELVQIDGSPHDWFEGRAPRCSLIVFIDDATSALVALRFVPVESTWAYFEVLHEYISGFGRPLSLYSDRHSIFRAAVSEKAIRKETQVGNALKDLDIELLCASTPQAKGRVERANRTLQQRLVRELRLRNISSIEEGNAFLPEFRLDYNHRFAVAARCCDDLHRPVEGFRLSTILCLRYERTVSGERTFQIDSDIYAIDDRSIKAKTRLSIRVARDGIMTVLVGSKEIAVRKLQTVSQGTVVDSKAIREPKSRRVPNMKKAHSPAPSHPWKQSFKRTLPMP